MHLNNKGQPCNCGFGRFQPQLNPWQLAKAGAWSISPSQMPLGWPWQPGTQVKSIITGRQGTVRDIDEVQLKVFIEWAPRQGSWSNASSLERISKTAKETLPQQIRRWEELKPHPRGGRSEVLHTFPDNWTVQRHPTKFAVQAVGQMMNNCWQGKRPLVDANGDPISAGRPGIDAIKHYMAIHDEHDIPQVAFYVNEFPKEGLRAAPSMISSPWGPRNRRITPFDEGRLREFGQAQGYRKFIEVPNALSPEDEPVPARIENLDDLLQRHAGIAADAEMVPISAIEHLMEYDRRPGQPDAINPPEYYEALKKHISERGFEDPLTLEYDNATGSARIGEGNHRLMIAKELGMTHVPVHGMYRAANERFKPLTEPNAYPSDQYGYWPSTFKPSAIGLPTSADAYEQAPSREPTSWYPTMYPEKFSGQ